jgi:hypothetical protein
MPDTLRNGAWTPRSASLTNHVANEDRLAEESSGADDSVERQSGQIIVPAQASL